MTIEPGDTVLHKPSGETWFVLKVDKTYVYPGGFPRAAGKLEDCEITKKGGEAEKQASIGLAKMIGYT